MVTTHPRLRWSTGDNALDLIACMYADAFDDARHDVKARADIVEFFNIDTLRSLHGRGIITWNPDAVPLQLDMVMEVTL